MGLNQIATLNVPTSNGEGTASDLLTMNALKSIELSGTYQGRFVILGSQDGTNYAPIAIFNSGAGPESFYQTLNVNVRYLKVRRKTSSGGTIVIAVAAETTSLNNYIAVSTLAAGATGPQATLDLWTLVPTTGLDKGISFIGKGVLGGSIVIEGSLNGTNWNPIGSFDSGLLATGAAVEFEPIVSKDIVRYVRANVTVGIVGTGGFVITLGGVQNTDAQSLLERYTKLTSQLLGSPYISSYINTFQAPFSIQGSDNANGGANVSDTADIISCTTDAQVNSRGAWNIYQSSNGNQPFIETGTSAEWLIGAVFDGNFVDNAAVIGGITYVNGDPDVFSLGYNGANAGAWTLRANSVSISGGVYTPNTVTRLIGYRVNGITYLSVNGVIVAQSALVFPTTIPVLCFSLNNNASAVARRMNCDEIFVGLKARRLAFP